MPALPGLLIIEFEDNQRPEDRGSSRGMKIKSMREANEFELQEACEAYERMRAATHARS